jgi:hypothetical protein
MGAKLGLDAKVYRLTTGTRATAGSATAGVVTAAAPANLDEVTCVQNVTWELTKGSADVSTRGNAGWGADLATLKRGNFNLECVYDPADTDMVALMAAYLTNSIAAFYIASGDKVTSGTQGLWADFQVHTASKTENLEEGQMITFTLKPTLTDVPPEWLKIT